MALNLSTSGKFGIGILIFGVVAIVLGGGGWFLLTVGFGLGVIFMEINLPSIISTKAAGSPREAGAA